MRTRLFGLYPFDANLPFKAHGVDPVVVAPPGCASATRDIIKCDVRVATQAVDVPGTPYTLAYTSARAAGAADRTLRIPVTGATMPAELMGAYVRVTVAGQTTEQQYLPAANLTYEYVWDGNDAYGRPVQGNPTAVVEIGHLFPVDYEVPSEVATSFGLTCTGASGGANLCRIPHTAGYDTERHSFWRVSQAITKLGGLDAKAQGLGGFDFNVHHQYDPVGRVLYLGDGTTRIADAISPVITTVYGKGCDGYAFDNIKATDACLFYPHNSTLVAMPDGSFLVPNAGSIKRVRPDGISVRFAGDYPPCPPCYPDGGIHGEGGPAINATVGAAGPIALAPDGSVYSGSEAGSLERIVRISSDGILTRVIGGAGPLAADGRSVQGTSLERIEALTVGPDGSVYFVQRTQEWRVYRIGPDSVIRTFAGIGAWGSGGDEQPAKQAQFTFIKALAFGPDGSLYIGQGDDFNLGNNRVRRVTPDGIVHLVVGGGSFGAAGVPATQRALFKVQSLYVNAEGTVSIGAHNAVIQVTADGIYHHVAGDPTTTAFVGDKGPSLKAGLSLIAGLAEMPDRSLLIYDADHHRVRKMAAPMPGFGGGAFIVANHDGSEMYSFDAMGRHLSTYSASTRKKLFSFEYDAFGRISALVDQHGNRTVVERDAIGIATYLSLPTGERITLRMNAAGDLGSLVAQGKDSVGFSYASEGLLSGTQVSNRSVNGTATFDSNGKLLTASNESGGGISMSAQTSGSGSSLSVSGDGISPYTFGYNANADGTRTTTTQLIGGARLTTSIAPDGRVLSTFPDGSLLSTATEQLPNVFGTSTSRTETLSLPSGLTRTRKIRRGTEGEDPTNIFDVLVTVDSTIVNGRAAVIRTDRSNSSIERTTAAGRRSVFEYDKFGRMTQMSWANRHPLILEYDEKGQISAKRTGNRSLILAVDSLGRDSLVTDANGASILHTYDGDGRTSGMRYSDGRLLGLGYDAIGQLSTVSMTGRDTIRVAYTSEGALSSFTPDGGSIPAVRYEYDRQSRPTIITYASGRKAHVDYSSSALDNAVALSSGDTIAHHYDPSSMKLVSATRARGSSLTLAYDGHLLKGESWSGPFNASTTYQHDSDFRIKEERVNGASPVMVSYDPDGRLVGAGPITFTRDATLGNATRTALGSVVTENWFSAYGELDSMRTVFGSNLQFKVGVVRDNVGRIVSRNEATQSGLHQWVYGYDTGGRLTDVSEDATPVAHYAYNAAGDRSAVTSSSGIAIVTPDREGKVLGAGGVTIGYDADGRRIVQRSAGDSTRIIYDDLDAISTVLLPHGQTLQYGYDAGGRRISRTVNSVVTNRWVYRGDAIIAELDASGAVSTRYIYGDRPNVPEGMVRGGRTYKLVQDERGSVRLVVDAATGEIVQSMEYDAFGRVIADSNAGWQPFGFAGGVYEPLTGFEQFGERDYDPATGTFLTRDPALLDGDRAGMYTYAASDPINHTDPSGLAYDINSTNIVAVATGRLTTLGLSAIKVASHVRAYAASMVISEQLFEGYENEIINIEESGVFPNLLQSIQWHHIIPKYLGGAEEGLQVALDSRYHTAITQAFQNAYAYRQVQPGADKLLEIIQTVYTRFPMSPLGWR